MLAFDLPFLLRVKKSGVLVALWCRLTVGLGKQNTVHFQVSAFQVV